MRWKKVNLIALINEKTQETILAYLSWFKSEIERTKNSVSVCEREREGERGRQTDIEVVYQSKRQLALRVVATKHQQSDQISLK